MKILGVVSVLFILSSTAFADDKAAKFDEHKQFQVKELDEQIATLQTAKTCITAASDHEAIKRCRQDVLNARKVRKGEIIDERINRLQKEKANLSH